MHDIGVTPILLDSWSGGSDASNKSNVFNTIKVCTNTIVVFIIIILYDLELFTGKLIVN